MEKYHSTLLRRMSKESKTVGFGFGVSEVDFNLDIIFFYYSPFLIILHVFFQFILFNVNIIYYPLYDLQFWCICPQYRLCICVLPCYY
jgi:hypothetical protein